VQEVVALALHLRYTVYPNATHRQRSMLTNCNVTHRNCNPETVCAGSAVTRSEICDASGLRVKAE
jgi:hypothetical protein